MTPPCYFSLPISSAITRRISVRFGNPGYVAEAERRACIVRRNTTLRKSSAYAGSQTNGPCTPTRPSQRPTHLILVRLAERVGHRHLRDAVARSLSGRATTWYGAPCHQ